MHNILTLTQTLTACSKWEDQVAALLRAVKPYGYDTYVIGVVPAFDSKLSELPILEENMTEEWISRHTEMKYGDNLSSKHCTVSNEPLLWSEVLDIAKRKNDARELQIQRDLNSFGYVGGVTFPLWTQWSPHRFGMSLTSSLAVSHEEHDQKYHETRFELETIVRLFFSYSNWSERIISHYDLSPATVAVFKAILTGRARKAVAEEMEISEHTVKYHIQQVRKKFKVDTGEQALVRFVTLGLTNLPSDMRAKRHQVGHLGSST